MEWYPVPFCAILYSAPKATEGFFTEDFSLKGRVSVLNCFAFTFLYLSFFVLFLSTCQMQRLALHFNSHWLFVIVPVAAFWQCLTLPLIKDDWMRLWISRLPYGLGQLLPYYFLNFGEGLFYRPAGWSCLNLLFSIFGETAWPCHVLALCVHMFNAWLVFRIVKKLTEDQTVSVLCGLIYSSAVAIHLDTLCWAVGICDLGCTAFFFMAISRYLAGRTLAAFGCSLLGVLFKEAMIILPAVLVALEVIRVERWNLKEVKSSGRRILPFLVLFAIIVGAEMFAGKSLAKLPASHPYALVPIGRHIRDNAGSYCGWMLQAFIPFGSIRTSLFRYSLYGIGLFAAFVLILKRFGRISRLLAGLSLWALFALLPFLFLPNHVYRYYAVPSLAPVICAVLLLAREMLELTGLCKQKNKILACAGTFVILMSIVQSNRILGQGLESRTLSDGTSDLIRGADFVKIVSASLRQQLPSPEKNTIILLGGVDLWSFGKDYGPQVWYHDHSIRVFDFTDLRFSSAGFFVENPIETPEEYYTGPKKKLYHLNAAKIRAFRLRGRKLEAVGLLELQSIAKRNGEIPDLRKKR